MERIGDIAEADVEAMFAVNVLGLISVTQLLVKSEESIPLMKSLVFSCISPPSEFKAKNAGHVINLGSVAGREPYAGGGIYCATKHAVKSFTGSLMRELVNTKIRVSEVQPGMVETEFSIVRFRGDKGAADKVYEGLQPRKSSVHCPSSDWADDNAVVAEDIAEEIVWVASRPPHVNIAEVFVLPVNQASAVINYREPKV